jgi:HAD superfamily hydrolase (TIGR01459 family)
MSVEAAFAEYEAVRHRLPPVGSGGGGMRAAADLDALADRYDVFLLDAFGVLNIGEAAIPGVPERVAGLRAAGRRVMVVTNAASLPRAGLAAKYAALGYDFPDEDIVSSRGAVMQAVRAAPPRRWGVMAQPELQGGDLAGLEAEFLLDDPGPYDAAEAFLLLGSGDWTPARQARLEQALRDRPREVWVGNPDVVAPRLDGFSVEPGHYAHRLADLPGVTVRFFGKPFGNVYELAFARLGAVERGRVVMVGDSLHTDILGARAAGIGSALVAGYGFLAGRSVEEAVAQSGIAPDWVLARP